MPLLFAIMCALLLPCTAEAAPLQYLSGAGSKAEPVVWLTWGLLAISIAVIVVIAGLLVGAIWHRPGDSFVQGTKTALAAQGGGIQWVWIGVGISSVVLLFSVVWTIKVLADIVAPPRKPAVSITVIGHQWWWEVHYHGASPDSRFTTANEIHIPTGQPVRLTLKSDDVIHSFWVPKLAGKMDTIPGLTNQTWIEADRPGTYRGQCTEYCGLEHARMGIVLVADPPDIFRKWWTHQLAPPPRPSGDAANGQTDFQAHCAGCHAVRGTEAAGALGPDLSHLMTRHTIAAGALPNSEPALSQWIADPQHFKPGALMPTPDLSARERNDVDAYLRTLD